MNLRLSIAITGLVVASCSNSLAAEPSLVLSGATVHTVAGETFSHGEVLVENGKVSAVGQTVTAPSSASRVDLKGQHLYPGMIGLDSLLGLTEIGAVRSTQDSTESGEFTPDVQSWIAANPDSELIPVARANAIVAFEPVPEGALVSGQSGLVLVDGWTSEQRTLRGPIGLHVFWPRAELTISTRERAPGSKVKTLEEQAKERRAKMKGVFDFFQEAAAYAKAKASAGAAANAFEKIPAWEAMLPYVERKLPVIVHADDVRQIRAAVQWAVTNHLKIVLYDGRDAWKEAALLATNKVPVVYSHVFTLPPSDSEGYDIQFRAPVLLHEAGVAVTFGVGLGSMDAALTKNLPYSAAQAVAFGLSREEAIKGITLYPAQIAGVADRLGSITVGKDATFFSSDGDILDIRSHVMHVWIGGKEVSLDNKHIRLYERYRQRPRTTASRR